MSVLAIELLVLKKLAEKLRWKSHIDIAFFPPNMK